MRIIRWKGLLVGLAWVSASAPSANPPQVELEIPRCAKLATRPRVCARIVDDGSITTARVLFRAWGTTSFYWTEMRFEGSRYCAWLPMPEKKTRVIDCYVEAVDNTYDLSRTREVQLSVDSQCELEASAPPEEPTCVGVTAPKQAAKPPGFESGSLREGC